MGMFAGSFIATFALQKMKPKKVLAISCLVNSCFNVIFSLTCYNELFGEHKIPFSTDNRE